MHVIFRLWCCWPWWPLPALNHPSESSRISIILVRWKKWKEVGLWLNVHSIMYRKWSVKPLPATLLIKASIPCVFTLILMDHLLITSTTMICCRDRTIPSLNTWLPTRVKLPSQSCCQNCPTWNISILIMLVSNTLRLDRWTLPLPNHWHWWPSAMHHFTRLKQVLSQVYTPNSTEKSNY